MEILGTHFKDSEIVGIGPLLTQTIDEFYGRHYVYFDLHLQHRSHTIKSGIFIELDNSPMDEDQRQAKIAFMAVYEMTKQEVIQLIS